MRCYLIFTHQEKTYFCGLGVALSCIKQKTTKYISAHLTVTPLGRSIFKIKQVTANTHCSGKALEMIQSLLTELHPVEFPRTIPTSECRKDISRVIYSGNS